MCATNRHVQEVGGLRFIRSFVGCINHSLESTNVVWVCKVDDIKRNVVLLETHANFFKVIFGSSGKWMSNEHNDSLSLRLVLSMLKSKLGYLDGSQYISITLDLNVIDTINQISNFVRLSNSQFASIKSVNQILVKTCLIHSRNITYLFPAILKTPTVLSGFY